MPMRDSASRIGFTRLKLTDSNYASAVNNAAAQVAKEPFVASVVNPLTQQGASVLS